MIKINPADMSISYIHKWDQSEAPFYGQYFVEDDFLYCIRERGIDFFDEDMRYRQDVFMWMKALLGGYSLYVNRRKMSITRIHPQQDSSTKRELYLVDRRKTDEYLLEHLKSVYTSDGQSLLKQFLCECYRDDDSRTAKKLYKAINEDGDMSVSEKIQYKKMWAYGKIKNLMRPI